MTVLMALDKCTIVCPACGNKSLECVELVDKDFAARNNLSEESATSISEDGIFHIFACKLCGFKLINNPFEASTSQIRCALLSHNIRQLERCSKDKLDSMVYDLLPMLDEETSKILNIDGTFEELKLSYLYALNKYLENCKMEDLVDAYNEITLQAIERAFSPAQVNNKLLSYEKVIVDD